MWSMRDSDFLWALIIVLGVGMALGWVFFDGIPLLWHLVKPWLHSITGQA